MHIYTHSINHPQLLLPTCQLEFGQQIHWADNHISLKIHWHDHYRTPWIPGDADRDIKAVNTHYVIKCALKIMRAQHEVQTICGLNICNTIRKCNRSWLDGSIIEAAFQLSRSFDETNVAEVECWLRGFSVMDYDQEKILKNSVIMRFHGFSSREESLDERTQTNFGVQSHAKCKYPGPFFKLPCWSDFKILGNFEEWRVQWLRRYVSPSISLPQVQIPAVIDVSVLSAAMGCTVLSKYAANEAGTESHWKVRSYGCPALYKGTEGRQFLGIHIMFTVDPNFLLMTLTSSPAAAVSIECVTNRSIGGRIWLAIFVDHIWYSGQTVV